MTAARTPPRTPGAAGPSDTARDRGPVYDPHVAAVMTLSTNLQRATTRELKDLWRKKKLSERGLFILEMVSAGLDQPSRLIGYFNVLPSTITFETDKLVAAGLLKREADPSDRRVVRLRLTDKGRVIHRETTDAINAVLKPQIARLTPEELETFLALFRKIVDPMMAPAAPSRAEPAKSAEGKGRRRAPVRRSASR